LANPEPSGKTFNHAIDPRYRVVDENHREDVTDEKDDFSDLK
jgi:hypothetical protein